MMLTDYNLSEHWADDDPDWIKSLVSSLERQHRVVGPLPLTTVIAEIDAWVELASGPDAWNSSPNRESLRLDLTQSIDALGESVLAVIATALTTFQVAFSRLLSSPKPVRTQPPGTRTDVAWTAVANAAAALLALLESDEAVGASWDDLVATAGDRTLAGKEYRSIADLLWDQLRRRGHNADSMFRRLVDMAAFGRSSDDHPLAVMDMPIDERIRKARDIASAPAELEPTVVWLGYEGRGSWRFSAGRVSFIDAHWAVPNADPQGQSFEHKNELWELVRHGHLFKVAKMVDDKSDVDGLVRVDLGETTAAGAVDRAIGIVSTLLNVAIHNSGGARPHLVQYGVLRSGRTGATSFMRSQRVASIANDHYGAGVTANALEDFGTGIAEGLAREELPKFLAAALDVQTAADQPFSREMMLRRPSQADISSVVPLADRVVQHVAAYAAMDPDGTFDNLGEKWPHARWHTDVQRAVDICLLGVGRDSELRTELTAEWYSPSEQRPYLLFVADRADDLLSLCLIESERAWVARMFSSVTSHQAYADLIDAYTDERTVLSARRRRVRNALVHGNPAQFDVIASVRDYSEFLSGTALGSALKAYEGGLDPATTLRGRSAEFQAMQAGSDAVSFWT